MSWLLKQAEEILNRVDQQTNAAVHQQTAKVTRRDHEIEFITDLPAIPANPTNLTISTTSTSVPVARTPKKPVEKDLIEYLNSSTSPNPTESKRSGRLGSSSKRLSTSSSPVSQPLFVTAQEGSTGVRHTMTMLSSLA